MRSLTRGAAPSCSHRNQETNNLVEMRWSRTTTAAVLGGLVVAWVSVGACRSPTEITVVLATDLPCDGLTARVGAGASFGDGAACVAGARHGIQDLGSIVLVPSGDQGAALTVVATVARGKKPVDCDPAGDLDCVVARRKLRFIPHSPLTIPVDLRAACLGKACGSDTTCVLGECLSASFDDPSAVADLDAGSTYDASRDGGQGGADAASDASPDAGASDGGPAFCTGGVLEPNPPTPTLSELAATSSHVFWIAGGAIAFYDVAAKSLRTVPGTGGTTRIAAADTTVYYSSVTGELKAYDIVSAKYTQVAGASFSLAAFGAATGASANPYYANPVSVLQGDGGVLFDLVGPAATAKGELAVTRTEAWVTLDPGVYAGPLSGPGGSVTAKFPYPVGTHIRELTTNGLRVAWLIDQPTPTLVSVRLSDDVPATMPSDSVHVSLSSVGLYRDTGMGLLLREGLDYPSTSPATKIIDAKPGAIVGKVVALPSCVYAWHSSATGPALVSYPP